MEWYNYLAVFFAAVFLENTIPHFVNGVSGNKFPTPFSKPPGRGLSSPVVNVLWAMLNLAVGYVLLRLSHMTFDNILAVVIFFVGVTIKSIGSAYNFQKKKKE